jgi:heterodisulfide reductase subunit D
VVVTGIVSKLLGGNVLYYPGCLKKFYLKELQENYEGLLRLCGIEFIKLPNLEMCCGSPVLNAGYAEVFKDLATENFKVFKQHRVRLIITSCPACFHIFTNEYPKILNFDIKVEHVTQTFCRAIEKGKLRVKASKEKIVYHDPCYLGRYCQVYEEPRKVLRSLGYEVVEMSFSREESWCCGGGGGVKANYPELAENMAMERARQAEEVGSTLVTTCPLCYLCLKEASEKFGLNLEVKELSQVLISKVFV